MTLFCTQVLFCELAGGKLESKKTKTLPVRGLVFVMLGTLALYEGTPLIAEALYELYHFTTWDPLYTAYGAARYLSAHFMLWEERLPVVLLTGLAGWAGVVWHWYRRGSKK